MENMAVLPPMPSARDRMAIRVTMGVRLRVRKAKRRSFSMLTGMVGTNRPLVPFRWGKTKAGHC